MGSKILAITHHNWNDESMVSLPPANIFVTASTSAHIQNIQNPLLQEKQKSSVSSSTIPVIPFYSQFQDITSLKWQKVGCGVVSLAMIIDYYMPSTVSVDILLGQGIEAGAYTNAGWSYAGLISLSKKYGLDGSAYDLGGSDAKTALARIQSALNSGPVIASIHYKFDPKSTIPHLVVINGIDNDIVYYNDPAANAGAKQISVTDFLAGWKKRFIVIRPSKKIAEIATQNHT
jgi:uncharacterized protein YvpB